MDKQMDYAADNRIPFLIFIGESELKENKIKIKCSANKSELTLSRESYLDELLKLRLDESLYYINPKEDDTKTKEVESNKGKSKKENKK